MHMTVRGINFILSDSTRAYAEYRFFVATAQHRPDIRALDVAFRRDRAAHRPFHCTVVVDLGSQGCVKTQARAMTSSAAIDRAADRTAWLVERRLGAPTLSHRNGGFQ
jgi:ribosome-associated translation inhibitor RaiA